MKHLFSLLLLLTLCSKLNAQYEQVGWVSKFGLAGGFTPGVIFPDLTSLNEELKSFGINDQLNNGIFTLGGGGYVYVLFIKDIRIGGMGFGGSSSSSITDGPYRKEARYSIGGGGFTIEYTLPFIKRVAVSVGAIIGGGVIEIEIFRNKDDFYWNEVWQEISDNTSSSANISRKLKNGYFSLSPTINVDFPITRFIAIRLGGGYQFSLGSNWEIENGQTLFNTPSSMNGNTFFIQTGVFLGFFAF